MYGKLKVRQLWWIKSNEIYFTINNTFPLQACLKMILGFKNLGLKSRSGLSHKERKGTVPASPCILAWSYLHLSGQDVIDVSPDP